MASPYHLHLDTLRFFGSPCKVDVVQVDTRNTALLTKTLYPILPHVGRLGTWNHGRLTVSLGRYHPPPEHMKERVRVCTVPISEWK